MPQVLIPSIGSIIILSKDWKFKLYFESRNISIFKSHGWIGGYWGRPAEDYWKDGLFPNILGIEKGLSEEELKTSFKSYQYNNGDKIYLELTIPKGSTLIVRRIYIRNGKQAFDSVTFTIKNCPDKKLNNKRFWAKLSHVNEIFGEII